MSFAAGATVACRHAMAARRRRPKQTERLSAELLEKKALSYLERFDTSAARLRQVLLRHVRRLAALPESELDETRAIAVIDELIGRYLASGVLDDARFATTLARGLRARGASQRAIEHKLRARGVDQSVASAAVASVAAEGTGDAELEAARALVRRRRLGPYRPAGEQQAKRRRDLGALARAGFSLDVAVRALGLEGSGLEGEF